MAHAPCNMGCMCFVQKFPFLMSHFQKKRLEDLLDDEAPQFGVSTFEENAPLDQTFAAGTHEWGVGETQNYNVTIEFTGQNK